MRRHDREVSERTEIDRIIRSALVCRIAFADDNEPYMVPISFGYDGASVFIHTAGKGRKIDFIEANNRVCFEFEANVDLRRHDEDPCAWTFEFESVIGYGHVIELLEHEEKAHGLNQIMLHYSDREWSFSDRQTATTRVWRIDIESVTGKRSVEKPGGWSARPSTGARAPVIPSV
jgi:nitroimidazol reductase NimA-like FMN-containing flavoprotein (pyridoxamine 5'-phosphate oxidase superfamily)